MYLHIGNGKSIRKRDIIGVFDLDTATVSRITKKFINKEQMRGNVEYSDTDLPRSFVIEEREGKIKVTLSRISTSGLKMRAESTASEIYEN